MTKANGVTSIANIRSIEIIVLICFVFFGCNGKDHKSSPARQIDSVKLYVDNSASMGGYFNQDAGFKTVISKIVVEVNKVKPLSIYYIADSIVPYQHNNLQFISDIAQSPLANQKSSQLHKTIGNIAERTNNDNVSLFISDCILSFPDDEIKKNPQINITDAPSTLNGHINSAFSNLRKKGFATSVYAFVSKFYGTYFDYQNRKTPLTGQVRPYYVWIIADSVLLKKFDDILLKNSSLVPLESMHFGLFEKPVTQYSILPPIESKGSWRPESKGIKKIQLDKNDTVQFCISVNLANLPNYARQISYIKHNMVTESPGCDISVLVKEKSAMDKSKLKGDIFMQQFENATHFFIITITSMASSTSVVRLNLPFEYDNWYLKWSAKDDSRVSNNDTTTFALEHLINGVKDAYDENKTNQFFDFSISLNK